MYTRFSSPCSPRLLSTSIQEGMIGSRAHQIEMQEKSMSATHSEAYQFSRLVGASCAGTSSSGSCSDPVSACLRSPGWPLGLSVARAEDNTNRTWNAGTIRITGGYAEFVLLPRPRDLDSTSHAAASLPMQNLCSFSGCMPSHRSIGSRMFSTHLHTVLAATSVQTD